MITGWGCLTITTGCGYRRGGGGRLPMSTRPYTPGWLSPWMLTPTLTSAACTRAGPAASRPAAIKGIVLFISPSPEKTLHDRPRPRDPQPCVCRPLATGNLEYGRTSGALRTQREFAEQGGDILRAIDGPQVPKNGVGPLAGPVPAHIAAEFPLDFGPAHRPSRETWHVVDL